MDTSYADACLRLEDRISSACASVSGDLDDGAAAAELRLMADACLCPLPDVSGDPPSVARARCELRRAVSVACAGVSRALTREEVRDELLRIADMVEAG